MKARLRKLQGQIHQPDTTAATQRVADAKGIKTRQRAQKSPGLQRRAANASLITMRHRTASRNRVCSRNPAGLRLAARMNQFLSVNLTDEMFDDESRYRYSFASGRWQRIVSSGRAALVPRLFHQCRQRRQCHLSSVVEQCFRKA